MPKVLEVRITVSDSTSDADLKTFGEHLQELLPTEFLLGSEIGDMHATDAVIDVTFEVK